MMVPGPILDLMKTEAVHAITFQKDYDRPKKAPTLYIIGKAPQLTI
jgi:hypothetical protein